jgi:uroporphyrinogen-III synthase
MEHRTYLWLHLTLDIIKKSPSEYGRRIDVEALLSSLPSEVSEAYEKILDKSKSQNYTEALLQVLLAATRPLTLDEANFALALATKEQGFDSHTALEDELWPSNKFKDDVKNLCGLFVTVHDGKLSFIHQTAREFLTHAKQGGKWKGRFNNEPKLHSRISLICMQYLLLPDLATASFPQFKPRYAFVSYAANSWSFHYASQEATDAYLYRKDALTLCCTDHVWKDIYVPRRVFSGLEWASYFGLQQIVQDILLEKADARLNLEAALTVASQKGHKEIAQMLLENGAGVNAKTLSGRTALYIASQNGYKEIVQMLLENGADVDAKTLSGRTALYAASEKGYNEIAQVLLENGADVNAKRAFGGMVLYVASENGHKETVQLLLENGADVNARGDAGESALYIASHKSRKEIVQMLQERGAK